MNALRIANLFTNKKLSQTVIIPDIPAMVSAMDGNNRLKEFALKYRNRRAMDMLSQSNGLVLLTEAMKDFVNKSIPYVVMEGIVDVESMDVTTANELHSDKEVILFVGDGGFQMTNQELALLNGYGVPIKVVLVNNHSLGMVRQWQESFYDEHRSESTFDDEPNFQMMAEAYGITHYKFTNPNTLEEDLKVITENKPMLIELAISDREQVYPMVPSGKSNSEMLGVKFNA
jgi:hypothetical protein